MIIDLSTVSFYIRPGYTDMRKAINGLSMIVSEQMEASPIDGNIYLFCNRQRRILKALYWDRNGFCLWQKRLEKHKFPWPQNDQAARSISYKELEMLLEGIDFWHAHQRLSYSSVK